MKVPPKPVILSHHQSRGRILTDHAIFLVLYLLMAMVVLWVFQFFSFFAWTFAGLTVVVMLLVGHIGWIVRKQPHGFSCVLWSDRIACRCPDETMGSTFDLPLGQIAQIRQDEICDSRKLVIVATDRREYWLTSNFGNPDMGFALEIQALCPKVQLVQK